MKKGSIYIVHYILSHAREAGSPVKPVTRALTRHNHKTLSEGLGGLFLFPNRLTSLAVSIRTRIGISILKRPTPVPNTGLSSNWWLFTAEQWLSSDQCIKWSPRTSATRVHWEIKWSQNGAVLENGALLEGGAVFSLIIMFRNKTTPSPKFVFHKKVGKNTG